MLQHTGGTHAGVGDDQWSLDAHAHTLAGQQAHDAGVNLDLGQVQDAGHGVGRGRAEEPESMLCTPI
jgi:hypothetical protein